MMIKIKGVILIAALMLLLAGCGKAEPEQLTVYSFHGEDEQLAISNGIIVLHGTTEIFHGGDLKVADHLFADITSYSTTFYRISGNERDVILSNSEIEKSGKKGNAYFLR